jgi:hypothetical protein
MTMNQFRLAAVALIAFNILGSVATWVAGLQNPKVGVANALGGGTQFTGPLVLLFLACCALALTYTHGRITQRIGIVIIGLWGASFALGDLTQLFQHNDGISSGRWDVVLAGAVVGMVLGIITVTCAVRLLVAQRRERRLGQVSAA